MSQYPPRGLMLYYKIIGMLLILGGTLMLMIGGYRDNVPAQIGGLVMLVMGMGTAFMFQIVRIEKRLRDLEQR